MNFKFITRFTKEKRTHKIGGGWGDAINWFDYDKRSITGHKTPLPNIGDFLLCPMQSGKTAKFEITKVEPCGNPPRYVFCIRERCWL